MKYQSKKKKQLKKRYNKKHMEQLLIKSETSCPTCGVECTVGGDDREGTHYYIPISTRRDCPEDCENRIGRHCRYGAGGCVRNADDLYQRKETVKITANELFEIKEHLSTDTSSTGIKLFNKLRDVLNREAK